MNIKASKIISVFVAVISMMQCVVTVKAATPEEMERARTIAAQTYIRYQNESTDYLDGKKPHNIDELLNLIGNRESDIKILVDFLRQPVSTDYANWGNIEMADYWASTFFKTANLSGKIPQACKNRIFARIRTMDVTSPQMRVPNNDSIHRRSPQMRDQNNNSILRRSPQEIVQNNDTLLRRYVGTLLREPYNKQNTDALEYWLSSVPTKERSEYFNLLLNSYRLMIINYESYSEELANNISRIIEVIVNIEKDKAGASTRKRDAINSVSKDFIKGNLKGSKSSYIPNYYKQRPYIPYLDEQIDAVVAILNDYNQYLAKPNDLTNNGTSTISKLNNIIAQLTGVQTSEEDVDEPEIEVEDNTPFIAVQEGTEQVVEEPVQPKLPRTLKEINAEIATTQSELDKVFAEWTEHSKRAQAEKDVTVKKALMETAKSEEAKKGELSAKLVDLYKEYETVAGEEHPSVVKARKNQEKIRRQNLLNKRGK